MVEVVKCPKGRKIIDQAIEATISSYDGTEALVTFTNHGLSSGDYVYIESDIDEYNGFWRVEVNNANSFKIQEYEGADFVEYYQDADIEYYQTQEHDWNSIFLPIVYKISNDLWPVNTADTARTISSHAGDNGYTEVTLSGDIKATEVNEFEFVKISGAVDENLNGVWQIVQVISNSNLVISLPYSSTDSFAGATIQYYYNNYQVKVKVFAGLNALHPWADKKPYSQVAELSLTPDENNIVMFSVADYIRVKIAIKNNLTLFSLPLNLDAFTGFYIATAESYDQSDMYSLGTFETEFSNDGCEGYAIAGKLPFKNLYSGDYANYVMTSGSPALWLTNRTRLIGIEDKYFDVSFIKNIRGLFWLIIDKYVEDYLTQTEVIEYPDQGIGVYRIPLEFNPVYSHYCIRAHTPGVPSSGGVPATTLAALSAWTNLTFGWTLGANPTVSINGNGGVSNWIRGAMVTTAGYDYEFSTSIEIDPSDPAITEHTWALLDSGGSVIDSVTFNYTTIGTKAETFTLSATSAGAYLALHITNNTPFNTKNATINSAVYNSPSVVDDSISAQDLTEEICIDIVEACDVADGFIQSDDIRLLEDGDFRLLE